MEMQRSGGSLYGGRSHEADCKAFLPSKPQWSQIGFQMKTLYWSLHLVDTRKAYCDMLVCEGQLIE